LRQIWHGLPYLPHFRFLQSGLDKRHLAAVLLENDKILRQLWQGLPFLSQILYMRRMLLCRKSSLLLERAGNRRNFASSKPRLSEQRAEKISSYFERKRLRMKFKV